ncbi:hypothetical protein EJD97_012815 [Solanum chilense]|uniref:Uncharacterized protein n=1 Tax=Solanum chilense TaxID=4083 RepID=A0A6N2BCJ4_SOLCI|nr:hypothetical protein EJD97_012815 [Solanum chilense]
MACHDRPCPTMCATQGPCRHVTLDIVGLCVLAKGDNNISCQTSSDYVCCPREMMVFHARHHPTTQWSCRHATPDVVQLDDDMPRPMFYDRLCFPSAMMACHARRIPTECAYQGQ